MKQFYLIVLAIFFFQTSFSAPVIKAISNGAWSANTTWDLNRSPKAGDTIIINAGKHVTISQQLDLAGSVYMKVYGKIIFETGSFLKVGHSSSIFVYNNGKIEGDGSQIIRIGANTVYAATSGAITGPVFANSTTTGFDLFTQTPQPTKFIGFTLSRKNKDITVQWSTNDEKDANMYELERSFEGSDWKTIAYVAAESTHANLINYSYCDKNVSAKLVYYRVKQVDTDGRTAYTTIKAIRNEGSNASDIKIASIQNKVLLEFPQEVRGNLVVRFVTINGQVIDQQVIRDASGQIVLGSKVKGNHIISVSNGNDVNVARQVVL